MAHISELPVGSRVHWPAYSPTMKGTVYENDGNFVMVDWDGWTSRCDVQYHQDGGISEFTRIDVPRRPLIIIVV